MRLSTVEKFLLIAHRPIKWGFITSDIYINYGIIGAMLLEMSLEEKVTIQDNKLVVKSGEIDENQIISEISFLINNSKKPRKIAYWINKLVRKSNKYKWAILNDLVTKSIMRIENKTFLGIIPYRRSYLTENGTRDNLIQQLKNSILFRQQLNNDTIVVLGLIEACKMHNIITSDRGELKIIRKELKQIIKESPIADTVNKTIKQVQGAIIGAVIASTIASTSAAPH